MNTIDLLFKTLWVPNHEKLSKLKQLGHDNINLNNLSTLKTTFISNPDINKIKTTTEEHLITKVEQTTPLANNDSILEKHISISHNNMTTLNVKLSWEELEQNTKNCHNCKLCHDRKNVVIERGNRNAKWMFIGEAPGEQEDIQGKPFVGKSGQLLDKMIQAMNLDINNDVYIANIIKCRPPKNRNPEPDEIEHCKNYILNQIELVNPQIIILLGRFSIQTILNTTSAVGKLRKTVHKYNNKTPTIVTYHPSYLLRTPEAKRDTWEDLQLAMKVFSNLS